MTTPARQPQLTELDVLEILRDCKDIQDARRMVKDRLAIHTSAPAPAFKRCCDSCINVPCKVLNRVPCLAQEKQENVCEENGCTDIENCDEICQHSRLFSPLQMQEAKQAAAKAAREDECKRIYGLFHEVERLHLNGMAYPDLYNEMVERIKFIHTEPLSKDVRKKKPRSQQEQS